MTDQTLPSQTIQVFIAALQAEAEDVDQDGDFCCAQTLRGVCDRLLAWAQQQEPQRVDDGNI